MGLLNNAGENLHRMGAMMHSTDVDLTQVNGPGSEAFLRQSIVRCLSCRAGEQCDAWLAEGHEHAEPPAFCPNSARFAAFVAATK